MTELILYITETELNLIIKCVDQERHQLYGHDEKDRIKSHGDKYLRWKALMLKLTSAREEARTQKQL